MVGETVQVIGAGSSGNLRTTIAAYEAPGSVTLAAPASRTVDNAIVAWGTDNQPAFQMAVDTLSGTGQPLVVDPGTYILAEPINVSAGQLAILGSAAVTLVSAIAPRGDGTTGSLFYGIYSLDPTYSTTLSADVLVGSRTLQAVAAPTVGDSIQLISPPGGAQFASYFTVEAVQPAGAAYAVKVDRPIMGPFTVAGVNATTVHRVARVPSHLDIVGNGMHITGSGNRYIEIFACADCEASDIWEDESGGFLTGGSYPNSWDEGSRGSTWERCHADLPTASWGFVAEGMGEHNTIDSCSVQHTVLGGVGLFDNIDGVISNCTTSNLPFAIGAAIDTNGSAESTDCQVLGGDYAGSDGVTIGHATGTALIGVASHDGDYVGFSVSENASDTTLVACSARRNALYGLQVAAGAVGTQYSIFDGSNNGDAAIRASADCTGIGAYSSGGSSSASSAVIMQLGGQGTHLAVDLTIDNTSGTGANNNGLYATVDTTITGQLAFAAGALAVSGPRALIADGDSVLRLDDFRLIGTADGSVGLAVEPGSTARIGDNVDLSGAETPLELARGSYCNRGTVTANGADSVDVPFPDLRSTDHVHLSAAQPPPLAHVSGLTPGVGFAISSVPADDGVYDYVIGP
jgi:hypothetical protein